MAEGSLFLDLLKEVSGESVCYLFEALCQKAEILF